MKNLALFTATALTVVAFAAPASAVPNLVTNGGFESVTGGPGRSHEFGASHIGQTVDSWNSASSTAFNVIFYPGEANGPTNADTRFSENGQYLHTSTLSPDGGKFVALDGDTGQTSLTPNVPVIGGAAGPLTQTINGLFAGTSYLLTFYYAGAQYADRTGTTTDQLFASLGNQLQWTPVFTTPDSGFTGWTKASFTYTATTTGSEILSFLSNGTPTGLPPVILLDGVSLTQVRNVVVPEPAAIAVLGLGFAAIGAARLRRR